MQNAGGRAATFPEHRNITNRWPQEPVFKASSCLAQGRRGGAAQVREPLEPRPSSHGLTSPPVRPTCVPTAGRSVCTAPRGTGLPRVTATRRLFKIIGSNSPVTGFPG